MLKALQRIHDRVTSHSALDARCSSKLSRYKLVDATKLGVGRDYQRNHRGAVAFGFLELID